MEIKPPFLNLSKDEQKSAIEVLLFAAEEPLTLKYLFDLLIVNIATLNFDDGDSENSDDKPKQISFAQEIMKKYNIAPEYFLELINEINIDLVETNRPFQIINIAGGYQFATRPEYGELLQRLTRTKSKRKFSQASLETLSIIAYKQPVTKAEIEQIRGVNSNEIVNTLLEKNFIKIVGRKDALGKPLLFGTTPLFLKTFGLKSLEDLPKLREIEDIASDESNITSHIEVTLDLTDEENAKAIQETIDEVYGIPDFTDDNTDDDVNLTKLDSSEEYDIDYLNEESEDESSEDEFTISKNQAEKMT
ncbi:SMC-Scp complex subunit ScpB [Bacteroidetes/Chlorobi group bacterium ChocPot_Mid]|nr:MAG: SMC-Scp complex subunit ScpB [Bacteroidetes/Chlorobi group bacterium ChocPot_Mid]